MDTLLQDVRYALRSLRKSPAFVTMAVLCLAIGIGLNAAVFSVVETVFFTSFGIADSKRVVTLRDVNPKLDVDESGVSYPNLRDLRGRARSFSGFGACTHRSLTLTDGDQPERLQGAVISWDLFPTLGVRPILGRTFREDEDRPGVPGTVVLGYEVWKRRYQGDPNVIGRVIQVNRSPHTVLGVMPEHFEFPERHKLWIPMAPFQHEAPRNERGLEAFARLKPGVGVAQARDEVKRIAAQLEQEHPDANRGWSSTAVPLFEDYMPGDVRLIILAMWGAVWSVLLIACANVANLMLARASTREREIAIRTAMGARRGRIVRQLLTESLVIAAAAGVLGVLSAYWWLDFFQFTIPREDPPPYFIHWTINPLTLAYTLGVTIVTALLFGLAPALQASRTSLQGALKEGGRGTGSGLRRNRFRSALVVAQVALSLILLVAASLFIRSFVKLDQKSAGFDTRRQMTMRIYLPGEQYASDRGRAQRIGDLMRRIEGLPGVASATASNNIPAGGSGGSGGQVAIDGRPAKPGEEPFIFFSGVTPHWFATLGVPIVRGRDFAESEGYDSSRVAIVNQAMVKRFWPKEDPIGRRFRVLDDRSEHWISVVGVCADYHSGDVENREIGPAAFVPYLYVSTFNNGITVRTEALAPAQVMPAIRRTIREADPGIPIFDVRTLEQVRRLGFSEFATFGMIFSVFGAVALILAGIGVYGVISYSVTQRTHEIGVRMALGAAQGEVRGMVVRQGLRLTLIGVAIGVLGGLGVMQLIRSVLYDTPPYDPVSFGAVALFLSRASFLASYLPAQRATSVNPVVALRYE